MLLGWMCIGCQAGFRVDKTKSQKSVAPERCPDCGANVFQRIEKFEVTESLYPDKESEVSDSDEEDQGRSQIDPPEDFDPDVLDISTYDSNIVYCPYNEDFE